jgi:hypothetical protein
LICYWDEKVRIYNWPGGGEKSLQHLAIKPEETNQLTKDWVALIILK